MSKLKLSLLGALVTIAALLAYAFIPTHVRLGSEITNQQVGENYRLVGYKAISTKPQDGKLNHYFLIAKDATIEDAEPFLISSDPFSTVDSVVDNKLSLSIKGRVKHFDNDLWVEKGDGKVEHWYISANINYVR
ncbi:hypothetical protein [Vibrio sinaloensis]|uniref:Uncharacterized protein n=1 Tax=Photobacterium sp. (strain ATCC 43367) TaxID=379097 RepID=A0A0A5HN24_PHOS4|nr:hypothetical protein [Vibrio sinaloensis]KGY06952.1 hypothetical protein NM06_19700 [Vibrio sinaloensis]